MWVWVFVNFFNFVKEDQISKRKKNKKMWPFWWKGASGFSAHSTAEQVTHGIDVTALTAIVTGLLLYDLCSFQYLILNLILLLY